MLFKILSNKSCEKTKEVVAMPEKLWDKAISMNGDAVFFLCKGKHLLV
jgi:hypothetical protein